MEMINIEELKVKVEQLVRSSFRSNDSFMQLVRLFRRVVCDNYDITIRIKDTEYTYIQDFDGEETHYTKNELDDFICRLNDELVYYADRDNLWNKVNCYLQTL